MELVLTGRTFDAEEAERWGVISRVVREENNEHDEYPPVVKEALNMAVKIASFGRLSAQAGKEAVNAGTWSLHVAFHCSLRLIVGQSFLLAARGRASFRTSVIPWAICNF